MAVVAFINFVVIILVVFFLYSLAVLYFRHTRSRADLKNYLGNTLLLTRAERHRIAGDISYDEAAFRKSTRIFLLGALIATIVICLLLFFAQINVTFGYILLFLIILGFLIWLGFQTAITHRNRKLVDQLPNAIEMIIHYTLNNVSIQESIRAVAKETPMPLARFFKEADNRISGGETVPDALRNAARPYHIFELNYFVMVLILQLETGSDTTKVLRRLVEFLRRERILQQKIRAVKADINAVQWGLPLLILAMVIITYILKPEYLSSLLASPLGVKLVIAAILLFMLGLWLIQRVTRVV